MCYNVYIRKGKEIPNTRKANRMSYKELVNHIKENNYLKTRWDIVCWLIGYQGKVDSEDLDNIEDAYLEGLID